MTTDAALPFSVGLVWLLVARVAWVAGMSPYEIVVIVVVGITLIVIGLAQMVWNPRR
jgi:hypothetical protein